MPFTNPIVGGTTLVRSAIKSPNYMTGISGWTVNADGSAEFTSLKIGGSTVTVTITFSDGSQLFAYAGNYNARISSFSPNPNNIPGTWLTFRPKNVGGKSWNPGAIGTNTGLQGNGEGDLVLYAPWDLNAPNDYSSALYLSAKGSGTGTVAELLGDNVTLAGGTAILTVGSIVSIQGSVGITAGGVAVAGANTFNSVPLYNGPVAFPASGIVVGAWTNVTLANLWVSSALAGFTAVPGYRVDAFGQVQFRGQIKSGTGGAAAFTLPAGLRPAANKLFACGANSGSDVYGRVVVQSNGQVVPGTTWTGFISLDGIQFLAEA